MDFTMTFSLLFLLLLVPATSATYMSEGAKETQFGVMPMDGVSPAPTEAPGLNGIPDELRKRALSSTNWCGLIDGDPESIYKCEPFATCVLKMDFYIACCTDIYTDLCLSSIVLPTRCVDYNTYTQYTTRIGSLTNACSDRNYPYCFTFTSNGLSPQYGCAATSYPRIHSFLPIAAHFSSRSTTSQIFSSRSTTPQITISYPYPPLNPTTKITYFRTPTSISDNNSESDNDAKPKFKLPNSAKAGIGSAAGLVTLAIIALFSFCFRRRRRNRAHASPTDVSGEPVMAQINITPKNDQSAAQPEQQQYQLQPQGYQGAALPVQQQYQPQLQGYQNPTQHYQYQPLSDNRIFTDSADSPPYYPAPVYTSGSQQTPAHPIPPKMSTSDPKISSQYPASPVPPALPLSPNLHQQQHDPLPPWNHTLDSPISTINPERSDLDHQGTLPTHAEIGGGEAGLQNHHHTGTPQNHSELGAGPDHSSLPRNQSELPGVEEARAPYPGPPNNYNRPELGH